MQHTPQQRAQAQTLSFLVFFLLSFYQQTHILIRPTHPFKPPTRMNTIPLSSLPSLYTHPYLLLLLLLLLPVCLIPLFALQNV